MAASEAFIAHLTDCLAGLGPVSVRRMFGGAGVYCDRVMFALVADDMLYFKADDSTKIAFVAEGLTPFVYHGKGKPVTMSYWRVPERLHDDPDEMVAWARTALAVAQRSKSAKPPAPVKGAKLRKPRRAST